MMVEPQVLLFIGKETLPLTVCRTPNPRMVSPKVALTISQ